MHYFYSYTLHGHQNNNAFYKIEKIVSYLHISGGNVFRLFEFRLRNVKFLRFAEKVINRMLRRIINPDNVCYVEIWRKMYWKDLWIQRHKFHLDVIIRSVLLLKLDSSSNPGLVLHFFSQPVTNLWTLRYINE